MPFSGFLRCKQCKYMHVWFKYIHADETPTCIKNPAKSKNQNFKKQQIAFINKRGNYYNTLIGGENRNEVAAKGCLRTYGLKCCRVEAPAHRWSLIFHAYSYFKGYGQNPASLERDIMPDGKVSSSLLDDKEIKLSGQREKHRTSIFKPPYLAMLLLKKCLLMRGKNEPGRKEGDLRMNDLTIHQSLWLIFSTIKWILAWLGVKMYN